MDRAAGTRGLQRVCTLGRNSVDTNTKFSKTYTRRLKSQIISVVSQIQRFEFDCNLVMMRKVIIRTSPSLGLNPL
jgi:hypothetical protein